MPELKDISAINFVDIVRQGDVVCWGQACGEPLALTERLMQQRGDIGSFQAFIGISLSDTPDPAFTDKVDFTSFCGTGNNRRLAKNCQLDILPHHYSDLPGLLTERVDVLLLQLAERQDGSLSLSSSCDYIQALLPTARTVVAEVNRQAPASDTLVDPADIDLLVRTDYVPAQLARSSASPVEQSIATHVAGLIEDGATLQFGLGGVPEAVAALLKGHKNLGLHTGVMSDCAVDLITSGAIDNSLKPVDHGVSVTGALLGTKKLFDFAHLNPNVALRPVSYTHNLSTLASLPKFTAINSAIEVDFSGQANTEIAAGVYVGAIGGAVDFARGAQHSPGGLPILALPSSVQTKHGKQSRIVVRLNGPAAIGRADVGIVVTEHGVADLRGRSLVERASALMAIADPACRDDLAADLLAMQK